MGIFDTIERWSATRAMPSCTSGPVVLVPEALGSLRFALNLVSEAVARALPDDAYLDVVVLNSAPELLERLEAADCLLVERVAEERRRALEAVRSGGVPEPLPRRRRWWPF
jgi:hypothetical protein